MAESTIAGTSALQLKNSDKDNGKIASQSSTSLCTLPGYWTVSEGVANRTGWSCRECKAYIKKGAEITVRDGRKMRFFYHRECFSADGDIRTQPNASRKFSHVISKSAPTVKGRGKWSVASYGYQPSLDSLT